MTLSHHKADASLLAIGNTRNSTSSLCSAGYRPMTHSRNPCAFAAKLFGNIELSYDKSLLSLSNCLLIYDMMLLTMVPTLVLNQSCRLLSSTSRGWLSTAIRCKRCKTWCHASPTTWPTCLHPKGCVGPSCYSRDMLCPLLIVRCSVMTYTQATDRQGPLHCIFEDISCQNTQIKIIITTSSTIRN